MIAGILITIREGLEAFLVIGILLGYLTKINQKKYFKHVWLGAIGAIVLSVVISFIFRALKISFEGESAELFEIVVAAIAIIILSYMVVWMQKQSKNIKGELQAKVDKALSNNQVWGITILAFVTVIREGIETALFLTALKDEGLLLSSFAGLFIAAIISVLLYKTTIKLNLRKFFVITGWLLIFIAAGLTSHAIRALGELGIIPPIIEKVWSLEWLIPDESLLGKLLHAFIGYESTPSLMQIIAYSAYILTVGKMFMNSSKETS
ncbi:iron permease [Thermoanaerobacter sp. YS13]|uniref:FTR1 family iron permease n=1 Tax=Thermoanaerobacter sp. YS13 TaxID=1511746 RepID=UPI000574A465|nr:FTR1 family protein [Thermoanaerobacter sp. YS13]KHO61674.1 iron permease [Thermoanaerobacter sp. YS13]